MELTKRIFSIAASLAMVVGLLAGVMGSAAAAPASSSPVGWIFFPSVPNGQTIEGTGPWYGSITIQNTESNKVDISFATTAGGTMLTAPVTTTLGANASQTFSAAQLFSDLTTGTNNAAPTSSGFAVKATWTSGDTGTLTSAPVIAGVEKQATPETSAFDVTTSSTDLTVDGYAAIAAPDVAWGTGSTVCTTTAAPCNDFGTSPVGKLIGAFSSTGISSSGTSYLPIVQANWSGWNTLLNITNIDASTPANTSANVTVTFYQAGSGTAAANKWTGNIAAGQTAQIDVANVLGTAPFVGSAQISSSYAMVANTVRVKASTNMAIINTSAPSLLTTTASPLPQTLGNVPVVYPTGANAFSLNAPLIFRNYQGWNTGINIANASASQNSLIVTFYNQDGTIAATSPAVIPGNGMQYVYIPSTANSGPSSFGSAVISGNQPFYAAVDEVKYSTGEAMSYMATGSTMATSALGANTLALPLFQNGPVGTDNVAHGDTSGINFSNPNSTAAIGSLVFYDTNGTQESTSSVITVKVPANGSTFVYAPNMVGLTTTAQLSAVLTVTTGQMAAVSNNVNYDVNGDGGSVFNLSSPYGQYRFACTSTKCSIQAVATPAS